MVILEVTRGDRGMYKNVKMWKLIGIMEKKIFLLNFIARLVTFFCVYFNFNVVFKVSRGKIV